MSPAETSAGPPSPPGGRRRRALLSMGSNLGDRRRLLQEAVDSLGADVVAVSPVYETAPVGGPEQDRFLNIVVELATALDPHALLAVCHRLESAANRVRLERWGPRTLDVDIIWIDGVTLREPDLEIPHPRMWTRRFVLAPLADVAPDLVPDDALHRSDGTVRVLGPLLDDEAADRPDDRHRALMDSLEDHPEYRPRNDPGDRR